MLQLHDTIVALATPPGSGARAIIRISGPEARSQVEPLLRPNPFCGNPGGISHRLCLPVQIQLEGLHSPIQGQFYYWKGPSSYTGQDLMEIHTISSPPLISFLLGKLQEGGARAAGPGEFTLRSFLAGKIDLTGAEAVIGVIDAPNPEELKKALGQLAGGIVRPMQTIREDLLNLLADVEAGLDFTDEDIQFVQTEDLLNRISKALAHLLLVQRQLNQRGMSNSTFRIALAGKPNAGKTTLFNALTGAQGLVSPVPGTTRDFLEHPVRIQNSISNIWLIDTAGLRPTDHILESSAQALGRGQLATADLVLLCLPDGQASTRDEIELLQQPNTEAIRTKADLQDNSPGMLAISAITGQGLPELIQFLQKKASQQKPPPLGPSLSRCHSHVHACLGHLRRAHSLALFEDPQELLALELRQALERIGEMVGAVYTDDLLDRIFSRFCIGK